MVFKGTLILDGTLGGGKVVIAGGGAWGTFCKVGYAEGMFGFGVKFVSNAERDG
jgi:hypothetical protein